MEQDAAARRREVLEQLKLERQQARAAAAAAAASAGGTAAASNAVDGSGSSAEQRKAERNALVQKLLSERNASGGAAVAPTGTRTAWEDRIDRHATQLQEELGLGKDRAATSTTRQQRSASADAYERAALEQAALEADALDLGALGAAELDAIGQQAAAELDRLGARGASALASALAEAGDMFPFPRTSTQQHADADVDPRGKGAAIPMSASAIPRTSPPYASRTQASAQSGTAGGAASGRQPAAAAVSATKPPRSSIGGGQGSATPGASGIRPPSPRVKTGGRPSFAAAPATPTGAAGDEGEGGERTGGGYGGSYGRGGGGGAADGGYTFQPRINSKSAKMAEQKRDGPLHARLASQQAEAYTKRETARIEMERQKMQDCTFAPTINKTRPKSARASVGGGKEGGGKGGGGGEDPNRSLPAGERLHRDADRKAEMAERKRLASERWAASSHRFAPHINPTSTLIASEAKMAPLHERVEELQRKKEEHLHRTRMQLEDEQDATFKPQINHISAAIAAAVHSDRSSSMPLECGGRLGTSGTASSTGRPSVVDRLSAEASLALERRAQRELQKREAEELECPFKPQTNVLSERIVAEAKAQQEAELQRSGGAKGNDSIFQRLHSKAEELEERRKQREAQALEEEGRLFQPTVSEANDILLTARSARLNESHLERTERLAYVDMKRREAIRQQLEQAHYSQYTHQPKIDTISARLARSKTDAELSANPQGKALKESLAKKKEKLEAESCPFKPQLDRRSQQLAEKTGSRSVFGPESVDHLTERLELEARERQERLERQRREVEAEKLRDCTFQPQISSANPSAHEKADEKPLVIRGLGRYMELKQMAKRQQDAQKQREQKAFLIEPPARLHPYTVPEPFHLNTNKDVDERTERARAELERERMQECTFAPQTNEASVELLLSRAAERGALGYQEGGYAAKKAEQGYARK